MISRTLFVAVDDYISVILLNEKGKSRSIPFEGENVFKITEDFWKEWCEQTSYIYSKNADESKNTICDFCFITDKDYPFTQDDFLKNVVMVKDSIWNVERMTEVLKSAEIVKDYNKINVKMPNLTEFSVIVDAFGSDKILNVRTNVSDEEYAEQLKKIARQKELKRQTKEKAFAEKNQKAYPKQNRNNHQVKEVNSDTSKQIAAKEVKVKEKSFVKNSGEDTAFVKYNKKLRAEEKINQ